MGPVIIPLKVNYRKAVLLKTTKDRWGTHDYQYIKVLRAILWSLVPFYGP